MNLAILLYKFFYGGGRKKYANENFSDDPVENLRIENEILRLRMQVERDTNAQERSASCSGKCLFEME